MHTVCKEEVKQRLQSPSGKYVAEVSEGYCTVAGGIDTDVMIRERPFVLSNPHFGNAADVFYLGDLARHIEVRWNGDAELIVRCADCKPANFRVLKDRWKDISILYSDSSQAAPKSSPH